MRSTALGQFWLTILLLVSTLASSPLGSMEQGVPETIGPLASAHAVPAARHTGASVLAALVAEPHGPGRVDRLDGEAPLPAAPSSSLSAHHHRAAPVLGSTGTDACLPLCERLPYRATAPPAAP